MKVLPRIRNSWKWVRFVVLFIILFSFLTCEDDSCAKTNCGDRGQLEKIAVLTPSNSTVAYATDTACAVNGAAYLIHYHWVDNPKASDRPPISIKVSTLEGTSGRVEHYGISRGPNGDYWSEAFSVKGGSNNKENATCRYAVRITLQRPLIKLPAKGPSFSLPFIGPVIGPDPGPVQVEVGIDYWHAKNAKE